MLVGDGLCKHKCNHAHGAAAPAGWTIETGAVGPRSVAYDSQVPRAMIRWACTVRRAGGSWLLEENPLPRAGCGDAIGSQDILASSA